MVGRSLLVLATAALLAGAPCHAVAGVKAPRVSIKTLKALPQPLPVPYDEAASDAQVTAQVDAAFERAKASNKRVLLDFGGNWCGWCRILDAVVDLPEVKSFVDAHYEVVHVFIASKAADLDHNLAVVKRFKMKDVYGYPWVVIANADGKVLVSSPTVTDEDHQTPQAMVDWIAKWAA